MNDVVNANRPNLKVNTLIKLALTYRAEHLLVKRVVTVTQHE